MPIITNLEDKIVQLVKQGAYQWFTVGVNLGGAPGASGGSGGPIGGFIGQLIQSKVAYDTTEDASLYVPVSGQSLIHNLNRIRYWINQKSDQLIIKDEGIQVASGITTLNFVGAPVEVTESGGIVTITVSGTGGDGGGETVKVSSDDTVANYLENKLTAGSSKITVITANPGGNEERQVDLGTVNIDDLNDVTIISPSEGDALRWSSGTSQWIPSGIAGDGGEAITVYDEGVPLTTSLDSLNFVGPQVQATNSGDAVTVSISGVLVSIPAFVGCRTYRTSDWQISTDNGWQNIDWEAENYDTDSMWSAGGNHTLPNDGYYNVIGHVTISGAVPTAERIEVSLFDGSSPIGHAWGGYYAASPGIFTYICETDWYFSASDNVNIKILCGDTTQPYVLSGQDKTFLATHQIQAGTIGDLVGCSVYVDDSSVNDPPNETDYDVKFGDERYDTSSMWSGGDNTKIYIPEDGYYSIKSQLLWQGLNETPFEISHRLELNDTTDITDSWSITIDNNGDRTEGVTTYCSTDYYFSASDYIKVVIWHDRGSTFDDAIRSGDGHSYITVHKIGA